VSEVEQHYRSEIGRWSGQERVRRSAALLAEMKSILARKIAAADPSLDRAGLERRVAECLYRTDREARRLLDLLDG
jgi:hypothetical protein